jgi:hypothetical protein
MGKPDAPVRNSATAEWSQEGRCPKSEKVTQHFGQTGFLPEKSAWVYAMRARIYSKRELHSMSLISLVVAEVEKKKPEYILGGLATLSSLLLGAIFWGWLYGLLARTGAVIPKLILGEVILLLSVWLLAFIFYAFHYKREAEKSLAERDKLQDLIDNPPRKFAFNVYWDNDGVPYCPMDKNMPLGNWMHMMHGFSSYHCPMHNHQVPLRDDEGNPLTPNEARRQLVELSIIKPRNAP